MKKIITIFLALTLVLSLAACSNSEASDNADANTIVVGASATPHAEILEQIKSVLAEEGYTLEIKVFDDYVLPNKALADGELDANYFQHTPYLNNYNAENGTDLVAAASIHYEPFGVFGNGVSSLSELAPGATIIIPADGSNETRALFVLQQEGLITLPENADAEVGVTTLDIVDDGGYNIVPVAAETVPAQLENADEGSIAVINGNYALAAGLDIADALAVEDASGAAAQTYANIIAVRSGEEICKAAGSARRSSVFARKKQRRTAIELSALTSSPAIFRQKSCTKKRASDTSWTPTWNAASPIFRLSVCSS